MIKIRQLGDFSITDKFLKKAKRVDYPKILDQMGSEGILALYEATPKKTGKTASSWQYRIEKTKQGWALTFENTNINEWACIAVLIQYGHATPSGYYVEGIDYINPALKPVFEKYINTTWEEVTG